jgi:hypothetical protein
MLLAEPCFWAVHKPQRIDAMTTQAGGSFSKGTTESNFSASQSRQGAQASSSGSLPQDSARDSISSAATKAGTMVVGGINSQKTKAAEGLGSVAQALRKSSEELRTQDASAPLPQYITTAADQVERLSGYLRNNSVSDMVNGVEEFARRQPAIFLGSACVLGLVAARFLKSSARSDTSRNLPVQRTEGGNNRGALDPFDPRTSAGYSRVQQAAGVTHDESSVTGSRRGI